MTVYLNNKNSKYTQVEKNVKTIAVEGKYINIAYKDNVYGIVTGVRYYTDEVEISKVEV